VGMMAGGPLPGQARRTDDSSSAPGQTAGQALWVPLAEAAWVVDGDRAHPVGHNRASCGQWGSAPGVGSGEDVPSRHGVIARVMSQVPARWRERIVGEPSMDAGPNHKSPWVVPTGDGGSGMPDEPMFTTDPAAGDSDRTVATPGDPAGVGETTEGQDQRETSGGQGLSVPRPPLRARVHWTGSVPLTPGARRRALIQYNTSPLAVMVNHGRRGLSASERRELMRPLAEVYVERFREGFPDWEVSLEPANLPDDDRQAKYQVVRAILPAPLYAAQQEALCDLWATAVASLSPYIEAEDEVLLAMGDAELATMLRATRMRLDGQAERIIRVADELLMAATGLGPMDDMDLVIRIERGVSGTMVETLYASRPPARTDQVPVGSFLMIGSDRCGVYDIVHEITQIMVHMVGGEGDEERPIFIWHLRALLQRLVASGTLNAIETIAAAEVVGHPSGRVRILSDDAQVVAACWRRTGAENWGRSALGPEPMLAHLGSLPARAITVLR
jgi:hypothetical protein